MINLVIERLTTFNYVINASDRIILKFLIDKVINDIKTDCYIDELPKELESAVVDRISALFLMEKKAIDPDSLTNISLSANVKQVQEGDTSVTFGDIKTNEQRLEEVLAELNKGGLKLSCYRRIRW